MMARDIAIAGLVAAVLMGCTETQVVMRYRPDATLEAVAPARALTIFTFSDERGSEGDHDIFRVGGLYFLWTRLVKVMTDNPWPRALSQALAAGFTARGAPAMIAYRPLIPGTTPFETPYAMTGEINNFSTEFRFGIMAHISGIVRLTDRQGSVLVERRISERRMWAPGPAVSNDPLEDTLNKALAGFVFKVVTDPEINSVLTGQSGS